MTNIVIALCIAVVMSSVAVAVRRRQQYDAPTQKTFAVPVQIDFQDFVPGADISPEWLIVVFTSSSCHVCADVWDKARALESRLVAVRRVDYEGERDLHTKYRIEAVPALVICDREGVVRHHVLGPVSATDLWAAVARVRDPQAFDDSGECR